MVEIYYSLCLSHENCFALLLTAVYFDLLAILRSVLCLISNGAGSINILPVFYLTSKFYGSTTLN